MGSGDTAKDKLSGTQSPAEQQLAQMGAVMGLPGVADIMSQYGAGGLSLQDALEQAKGLQYTTTEAAPTQDPAKVGRQARLAHLRKNPGDTAGAKYAEAQAIQEAQSAPSTVTKTSPISDAQLNQLRMAMLTDPQGGMNEAIRQIQEGGLTSDVYGEGGLAEQLAGEQKELADTGFSLQPEDRTALGQVLGDVTRQYGQQENELANVLASRGLSAAPSGAAGAGYSGVLGNKYEQLAKAQQNIAQARMDRNLQRLQQTRQMMGNLASEGMGLAGQGFNRAMQARKQQFGETAQAAGSGQTERQMQQEQANKAFEQKQATSFGLGDVLGAVGGGILGGATGGIGSALGGKLGKSLFGGTKQKPK